MFLQPPRWGEGWGEGAIGRIQKMTEQIQETKNIGLRGVKVADTRISDVDGER